MNHVYESRSLHTYAEPLAGLRVSWGAVLAGALAMVGVSLLLWALALAIVLTASSPTLQSIRADAMALWVSAMATTLLGAVVGGALSGFLPGNPRRAIGGIHGFLSWATAFVFVTVLEAVAVGSFLRTGIMAGVRDRGLASDTSALEDRGAGGGENAVLAREMLESLGYTPAQVATMLRAAGERGGETGRVPPRLGAAADAMVGWSAGLAWSWFGTWALAAAIATAAGAAATRRSKSIDAPQSSATPTPGTWAAPTTASATP